MPQCENDGDTDDWYWNGLRIDYISRYLYTVIIVYARQQQDR